MNASQREESKALRTKVCTIAARNYLAHIRVLARSLRAFHPDWPLTVLMVDRQSDVDEFEPEVEFVGIDEIGLPAEEAHRMATLYNITELSTALKPWLLRYLRRSGDEPALYLDPDIEIFASLEEVARLACRDSIVLTPHLTSPMPEDNLHLREDAILGAGIYNLGFIAVGPESSKFLEWWSGKLRRQCVIDPPRMRFTDQRWIDFVPGLYRHHILRDDTYNVAYWNLHSRQVECSAENFEVNGEPLRFFHYSGFDPDAPHLLSRHQGAHPRILLSQHSGVARLCREYAAKLRAAGWEEVAKLPYRFGFLANGLEIDFFIRQAYRTALDAFEAGRAPEPPHPFLAEGEGIFLDWLNQPLREAPIITRYMLAMHQTVPDLQRYFPDPLGSGARGYFDWCATNGVDQGAQAALLPPEKNSRYGGVNYFSSRNGTGLEPGVTVTGYLTAELGVGEAARLVIAGLEEAKVPVRTIIIRSTVSRQDHPYTPSLEDEGGGDINIMCVNADATPAFVRSQPPHRFRSRSSVGFWFWEIEEFPESMHEAFAFVDEVWVSSEFTRQALLKVSPKPIYKFALPVLETADDASFARSDLFPRDGFAFLFVFDFLSVFQRKNPLGLIAAFRQAFPAEGEATLIIKSINGHHKVLEMEKLHYAARDRADIVIQDGYLSAVQKNTMTRLCDCYVSLHRAEGYGLTIAEAMAVGKPVIATGYSGNLEYMTRENSFLCSYQYREVGDDSAPYPSGARWAEPDLLEAAHLMRWVYDNRAEAAERGVRAASDMRALYSSERCGRAMRLRLEAIRQERCLG